MLPTDRRPQKGPTNNSGVSGMKRKVAWALGAGVLIIWSYHVFKATDDPLSSASARHVHTLGNKGKRSANGKLEYAGNLSPLMPESWCSREALDLEKQSYPSADVIDNDVCNKCDENVLKSWAKMIREEKGKVRESPLLFNIGANHGQHATAMLTALDTATVYSFELMPHVFKNLQQTWSSNKQFQSRWHVNNIGMSAVPGSTTVHTSPSGDSELGSIGTPKLSDYHGATPISLDVTIDTVANFLLSNFADDVEIDMLHIDAEGFDPAVIFGAHLPFLRHRIHMFTFEYGGTWLDERSGGINMRVVDVVRSSFALGYRCFVLGSRDLYPVTSGILDGSLRLGPHPFLQLIGNGTPNFICIRFDSPYYMLLPKYHQTRIQHCHLH